MKLFGYSALIEQYNLEIVERPLPGNVVSGKIAGIERPLQQLEFAIKHQGIHLDIIVELFAQLDSETILFYVKEKLTGKYRRKIWFLYEFLTHIKLDLEDLKNTPYVDLLDPSQYYVGEPLKSTRHAINNNLLGNNDFCPMLRKTKTLRKFQEKHLSVMANNLIKSVDPALLARATNYLYIKETKSSFGIEKIKPSIKRTEKFIHLLEKAGSISHLSKELFIELQNTIVNKQYKDTDYRQNQNYVGELTPLYTQKIHYISPKPNDLGSLMTAYLACESRLFSSALHPVMIAAILSFAFVFLHPFEDGNGRIHRFIIHYVLAKLDYTPDNIVFPVSAVMLKNRRQYDEMLESYSKSLMSSIENYDLNEEGELSVHQDTKKFYQYIDFTHFAEYLFSCIELTINEDFKEEIDFIVKYDQTKTAIQQIIDMPDLKIDRIIRCIAQNKGTLGKKMRQTVFAELDKEIVGAIEKIVQEKFMGTFLSKQ